MSPRLSVVPPTTWAKQGGECIVILYFFVTLRKKKERRQAHLLFYVTNEAIKWRASCRSRTNIGAASSTTSSPVEFHALEIDLGGGRTAFAQPWLSASLKHLFKEWDKKKNNNIQMQYPSVRIWYKATSNERNYTTTRDGATFARHQHHNVPLMAHDVTLPIFQMLASILYIFLFFKSFSTLFRVSFHICR